MEDQEPKQATNPPKEELLGLLDLNYTQAEQFFIKRESYCNFELPPYFCFEEVLVRVAKALKGKDLKTLCKKDHAPSNHEDVSHTLLTNKDGKYAWRPFTLIHPALYYSLVDLITKEENWSFLKTRFSKFQGNPHIQCLSLPVISLGNKSDKAEQILNWWHKIEQRSIEMSLDYAYMAKTDITDCYGSIYTHSLAWAINGKDEAKASKGKDNLLGDQVDVILRDLSYGQTNGIPQGSSLMDFIAEIVLGYADLLLSGSIEKAGIEDYHILRYRDDYRIFTNHPTEAEEILRILSETLQTLGFKLHPNKTSVTNSIIRESIKPDKLDWMETRQFDRNIQKQLLLIHSFITKHPSSGYCLTLLKEFLERLEKANKRHHQEGKPLYNVLPMIGITADIAVMHPRTHPLVAGILSILLSHVDAPSKIFGRIKKRLDILSNNGHLQIWLQRISKPAGMDVTYSEPLCDLTEGKYDDYGLRLWNSEWIKAEKLKTALKTAKIINKKALKDMTPIIPSSEVDAFVYKDNSELLKEFFKVTSE